MMEQDPYFIIPDEKHTKYCISAVIFLHQIKKESSFISQVWYKMCCKTMQITTKQQPGIFNFLFS